MATSIQNTKLEPSVIKACSRCRARKVKCDLKVPQCSACSRHREDCNITEGVLYAYSTVEVLLSRIQSLESQSAARSPLQDAGQQSRPPRTTSGPAEDQGDLSKEAEEIGILAVGGPSPFSSGAYVGSASGSTFARIFFKQLSLGPEHLPRSLGQPSSSCDRDILARQASLPSSSIAWQLFKVYVVRVHAWWPFLALPFLRTVFEQIYRDPWQCGDYEKFLVFAVLALASRSAATLGQHMMDMNTPESYFQSSLNFFSGFRELAPARKLPSIHAALLVGLWLLDTVKGLGEVWHLSRHAMSSAVEAGLHRYNADWGFDANEAEIRNRTWWCVYNLERQVATMTGRVLSIRDHAIQVPLPVFSASLDNVAVGNSASVTAAHTLVSTVEPFRKLIALRRLSGRILESVYVRRHPRSNDGNAYETSLVNTSLQQICAQAEAIGLELTAWEQQLESLSVSPDPLANGENATYLSELRIESSLLQLLLYRPSPAFMVPSTQMVLACGRAARTAIGQWKALEDQRTGNEGSQLRISARQFHATMLAGLAGLYCDWRTMQASSDLTNLPPGHLWLESDTKTCLGLLERGASHLGSGSFGVYVDLFRVVRTKVYGNAQHRNAALAGPSTSSLGDYHGTQGRMPLLDEDLEGYLSQVDAILDDGTFGMDETLSEWYSALIQGTLSPPTRAEDQWF